MASNENQLMGVHSGFEGARGSRLPVFGDYPEAWPLAAAAGLSAVTVGTMAWFSNTPALAWSTALPMTALTLLAWRYAAKARRAANERSRTEADLRASEERLRLAMGSAGMGTVDAEVANGESIWSSNRFELLGYPPRADGRANREMWRRCVHPDDLDRVTQALDTARRERSLYAIEHRVIRADDGRVVWVRTCGRYHYNKRGEAVRFTGLSFDDTARQIARLNDEFLFELDERLRSMSEADAIIDEAIGSLGRYLDLAYCHFGEKHLQHGEERIRRRWHRANLTALTSTHRLAGYLVPDAQDALDAGHPVVIADVHTDPRTADRADMFDALGVAAYATVPYIREGQSQARLAVLTTASRKWRDDEVDLIRRVLVRVGPLAANARATQALRESERRERERAAELETLLETVPAVVLIAHDPDSRRVTANRFARELLALAPAQQASLTAPERPTHYKVFANGRELAGEELPLQRAARGHAVEDFEETVVFSDGSSRHLLGNAVPLRDELNRPRGAIVAYVDVTERRHAEHAKAQLAAVVEASGDAIISRGLDRTILSWNPAAERLFGWSAEEAIGRSIRMTTPPETWGTRDLLLDRVKSGETIGSLESIRVRKDGSRFFGEVTYSPVKDSRGNVVSIATVVRDITARRQAEEALRDYAKRLETLSHQLVEVQERERAAIARELHDQIGQILGAANLRLRVIRRHVAGQAVRQALDEVGEALGEALQETRTLALSLRPPQLDDLGLARAVRLHAERLAGASQTKVHFYSTSLPRVPPPLDIACFRIAQEAVQNVMRHASAQNVWIDLRAEGDTLRLAVRDDGKGCDLAAVHTRVRQGESMGLFNMEERATLAGGTMEFESRPGKGMTIRAMFPLSELGRAPPS